MRDQVLNFLDEVFGYLTVAPVDAGQTVIFQFRVPNALLLHPFEHWPEDEQGVALGWGHPVVVAARERKNAGVFACKILWAQLRPNLHEPLCHRRWCPETPQVPADPGLPGRLSEHLDTAPCVVLARTPDPSNPPQRALLELLLGRGVPVALWPRAPVAEPVSARIPANSACPVDFLALPVRAD